MFYFDGVYSVICFIDVLFVSQLDGHILSLKVQIKIVGINNKIDS